MYWTRFTKIVTLTSCRSPIKKREQKHYKAKKGV